MHWLPMVMVGLLLVYPSVCGKTAEPTPKSNDEETNVPSERSFDDVNIFGDLGKSIRLSNTDERILWWERMVRGEVGRDRFFILCALRDGSWKNFVDIRDYVEFQTGEIFGAKKMHNMLVLMAGMPNFWYARRHPETVKSGEGWLEKNPEASFWGNETEWRIAPSVLPLLYFLLIGCPDDNRCK